MTGLLDLDAAAFTVNPTVLLVHQSSSERYCVRIIHYMATMETIYQYVSTLGKTDPPVAFEASRNKDTCDSNSTPIVSNRTLQIPQWNLGSVGIFLDEPRISLHLTGGVERVKNIPNDKVQNAQHIESTQDFYDPVHHDLYHHARYKEGREVLVPENLQVT